MLPIQVTPRRGRRMAVRWMLGNSRSPKPRIANRLTSEVIDVLNGRGGALKRRDDIYKIAQENRGQARF